MKAPKCAGIIHSDFEKGFIKAEVMSFNDLMQDGDIVYFRFNVQYISYFIGIFNINKYIDKYLHLFSFLIY